MMKTPQKDMYVSHAIRRSVSCPFCSREWNVCNASISSMAIDAGRKAEYCASEDYADCPMFLSKLLRRL
jgi:hypothetical protein